MANVYGRLTLIALLLFAGVSLWYWRVEERVQGKIPKEKKETPLPAAQKTGEAQPMKTDHQIILTRNIFKASLDAGDQDTGKPQTADIEGLAETKMQLVLLGTVAGSKDDARAIIRNDRTKQEDIYRIGGEVYGARITRIGRGKVVLQVNGREEVLSLKDPEGSGGQTFSSANAVVPRQDIQAPNGALERPASTIVPQRRISFRNPNPPAPEPVAPPEPPPAATDTESAQPLVEQAQPPEVQGAPLAVPTPPEGGDGSAGQ